MLSSKQKKINYQLKKNYKVVLKSYKMINESIRIIEQY